MSVREVAMKDEELAVIRRWSTVMSHVCVIAALGFLGGSIWQWSSMNPSSLALRLDVPTVRFDHGRAIAVFLLMCGPAAIYAYGLMQIRTSFRCFARGEIFSSKAILGLQKFGSAGVISVLVGAIMTPIIGSWLTYDSAAGMDFPIRISTGGLTIPVISGFTWTFARTLGIAAAMERRNQELTEENAAFV